MYHHELSVYHYKLQCSLTVAVLAPDAPSSTGACRYPRRQASGPVVGDAASGTGRDARVTTPAPASNHVIFASTLPFPYSSEPHVATVKGRCPVSWRVAATSNLLLAGRRVAGRHQEILPGWPGGRGYLAPRSSRMATPFILNRMEADRKAETWRRGCQVIRTPTYCALEAQQVGGRRPERRRCMCGECTEHRPLGRSLVCRIMPRIIPPTH